MYGRSPFAPHGASPPSGSILSGAFSSSSSLLGTSPTAQRQSLGRGAGAPPLLASISDSIAFGTDPRPAPAIMIRKLPLNISRDALGSMLLFAGDLLDTEIIRSPYPEDKGFATAVARFQSHTGALEAQQKLHGKPNTAKDANMIVEIHSGSMVAFDRRSAMDPPAPRTQTSSASSGVSTGAPAGGRSRFNSTFQSSDKLSPPLQPPGSGGSGEFPIPETSSHFQNLFSPQSPVANGIDDRRRATGKAMINDDAVDDETGELLKDPVGYARRPTNPTTLPLGHFASLSLGSNPSSSTGLGSTPTNGLTSPRNAPSMQSPTSPTGLGGFNPLHYPRPQYPPINPADQNPPCNTLYVGNLPIDTSEDELKAIFSKQRGYKRLCFRTKQNGPMCFVEFEDISFATKALNELYGHPLHNSVKGGIRLSFSKNPLGVRSGQLGPNGFSVPGAAPQHPAALAMSPHALAPGYAPGILSPILPNTNGAAQPYSSVSGPPPGLASPPGLQQQQQQQQQPNGFRNSGGMESMFAQPFGSAAGGSSGSGDFTYRPQTLSGGVPPSMNASYGRENAEGRFMLGGR